jgi:hypothetical protein
VDALVDVAAAGPATATERGVLLFNRDNQLWLARLGSALSASGEPRETPVSPLPEASGPFPLARAAAVRGDRAYWISTGRLLRQSLSLAGTRKPPEVLREDARPGTRAATVVGSAPRQDLPEMAAYVARPEDPEAPSRAKLWIEGQPDALTLTSDLSSASSVALVATSRGVAALFLEARTGMSTVHARELSWPELGRVELGDDHVVWVGGPARSSTEVDVHPDDDGGVLAWLPLERDITHFGLLRLRIPLPAGAGLASPHWWLYDNGIEPAPVASVMLCGRRLAVAARPSSALPAAAQELVLGRLGDESPGPVAILARSAAFFDVSLASLERGALLTYVADHRTWARTIRCATRGE